MLASWWSWIFCPLDHLKQDFLKLEKKRIEKDRKSIKYLLQQKNTIIYKICICQHTQDRTRKKKTTRIFFYQQTNQPTYQPVKKSVCWENRGLKKSMSTFFYFQKSKNHQTMLWKVPAYVILSNPMRRGVSTSSSMSIYFITTISLRPSRLLMKMKIRWLAIHSVK